MEDYLVIYEQNEQVGELIVPAANRIAAEATFRDYIDNGDTSISDIELIQITRL